MPATQWEGAAASSSWSTSTSDQARGQAHDLHGLDQAGIVEQAERVDKRRRACLAQLGVAQAPGRVGVRRGAQ